MRKTVDNVNRPGQTPGDDVLELVHGLMHRFRSLQLQSLRDGPQAVTHMESKVLGYFGRHAGATQSDLAQHSGRDKAQLARLIKGLLERGLMLATPDDRDRRLLRLSLTDEGRAVQRALQREAARLNAHAVAALSPAERQQLVALLRRVNDQIEKS